MNKTLRWLIALVSASLISYTLFAALGQFIAQSNDRNPAYHPVISISFVPIARDKHKQTNESQLVPVEQTALSHTQNRDKIDELIHDKKQKPAPADMPTPEHRNHTDTDNQQTRDATPAVVSPAPKPVSIAKHTPAVHKSRLAVGLHPTFKVEPIYPMFAVKRGIEGWVKIKFSIAENGAVVAPKVIASEPPRVFEQTALTAVSRWRYPPGEKTKSSVHIRFELRDR